jgi:hypothetical protein
MKFWGWLVLGLLLGARNGVAETEGAYQVEPMTVVEQGFNGGGPSNQFPRMPGVYNGLIMPYGSFVAEQSGYFRIVISEFRTFSGRMNIGDDTTPLRGRFNSQGQAGLYIYRRIWDDCFCFYFLRLVWILNLELVPGTDQIQGTIEHVRQGWTSDITGFRGYGWRDGSAPEQGRYTLRFPGSLDPSVAPGGEGYGAVRVDSHGQLSVSGQLADGTFYTRSAVISTNGWWPFYFALSEGRGALIGWLTFSAQPSSDVAGDLLWVRPRRDDRKYYPDGYTGNVAASGARYAAPSSVQTGLGWTNGIAFLSGGNLAGPATNSVTLRPGGGLTDNGGDLSGLTFTLQRGTGVFKGKFIHPASGRRTLYAGALDQLQGIGAGFFLGTNQGGLFRLESNP